MRKYDGSHGFLLLYSLTLIVGILTSEFAQETSSSPNTGIILILSLLVAQTAQQVLFGWRHFPYDKAIVQEGFRESEVYFKGSYLPTDLKLKKEKRFLESVYEFQGPLSAKIFMVVMALMMALVLRRVPNVQFSFTTLFQVAAVLSIVPIASFSHFLFPLFLNAVAVLLAFRNSHLEISFIPYCLLFFIACAVHSFKQREILLSDEVSAPKKERGLQFCCSCGSFSCSHLWGFRPHRAGSSQFKDANTS